MILHLTATDNSPYDFSIKQGAFFNFYLHFQSLDLTDWGLQGHIRKRHNDIEILAAFNFEPTIYGTRDNKEGFWSTIAPYLTASQTERLPVLRNRTSINEVVKPGINTLVYDIEATDPTNPENIIKLVQYSYIEVIPGVTRV